MVHYSTLQEHCTACFQNGEHWEVKIKATDAVGGKREKQDSTVSGVIIFFEIWNSCNLFLLTYSTCAMVHVFPSHSLFGSSHNNTSFLLAMLKYYYLKSKQARDNVKVKEFRQTTWQG